MQEGLSAEWDYKRRTLALAPRVPLKILAIILVAITTFVTMRIGVGQSLLPGLVSGAIAHGACLMSCGTDPRVDKGSEASFGLSLAELQDTIREAETRIAGIEAARATISNRDFKARLSRIAGKARGMLEAIKEEPTDACKSFRFPHVYLDGAQRVASQYGHQLHILTSKNAQHCFLLPGRRQSAPPGRSRICCDM